MIYAGKQALKCYPDQFCTFMQLKKKKKKERKIDYMNVRESEAGIESHCNYYSNQMMRSPGWSSLEGFNFWHIKGVFT